MHRHRNNLGIRVSAFIVFDRSLLTDNEAFSFPSLTELGRVSDHSYRASRWSCSNSSSSPRSVSFRNRQSASQMLSFLLNSARSRSGSRGTHPCSTREAYECRTSRTRTSRRSLRNIERDWIGSFRNYRGGTSRRIRRRRRPSRRSRTVLLSPQVPSSERDQSLDSCNLPKPRSRHRSSCEVPIFNCTTQKNY